MKPFDYFKNVYKNNYANFNGRARRAEYWNFTLFFFIIYISGIALSAILSSVLGETIGGIIMIPIGLFALASLIPNIALSIRRLHDTGKSGWFLLLSLIPLVSLYLLYLMVIEGDKGSNAFGSDPKSENLELEDNLISE